MKRYAILGYDDFWTSLLDNYLKINKNNRKQILNWGSGEFNNPIKNCRNKFLKHILITLQEFISIFVTKPEYGDNRFICQPLFKNNNLKHQWRNKYIVFRQEYFGLPTNVKLNVNQLYRLNTFISFEDYKKLLLDNLNFIPNENDNSYISLKCFLGKIYGNSNNHKYPPPVLNKSTPYGSHSTVLSLFESKSSGSKKYRRTFSIDKHSTSAVANWQATLSDFSINNDDIVDAFKSVSYTHLTLLTICSV